MSTVGNTTDDGTAAAGNGQETSSAEQARQKVQQTTQQAAGQARGRLREQVDQRSTEAGERVGSTADDARSVAQQLREQGKDQPAKLAEQAADRAERLGDYLKQSNGETILRDIEGFGRRQPWAVMVGGLTAGFLASRFLKASSSRRYETRSEAGGRQGQFGAPGTAAPSVEHATAPPASTVSPPHAPLPPAAGPRTPNLPREPGVGEPAPGRAAENVSLTGGVMPHGSPGDNRPGGPTEGTR